MFERLKEVIKKTKSLNENKIIRQILSNTSLQQDIISLNTDDQLYDKGIDSDKISLGEYAPATIEGTVNFKGKKEKGQRYDHITLQDTGKFYKSFRFKNREEEFIISANDKKQGTELAVEYGAEIIGLTSENKTLVGDWIKPDLIKITRENILK